MNIKFRYLYRDVGNFKKHDDVVLSNPRNLTVDVITSRAEGVLIEELWFLASQARLPDLHFDDYKEELDHPWHEFYEFQVTEEAPNDPYHRNIEQFLQSLRHASLI